MSYRLSQIPRLVEEGQLPKWVERELASRYQEIQELLEESETYSLRSPEGGPNIIIRR
jgi:hypothetical protein